MKTRIRSIAYFVCPDEQAMVQMTRELASSGALTVCKDHKTWAGSSTAKRLAEAVNAAGFSVEVAQDGWIARRA